MATTQSTNATGRIVWNHAFVPLALVIPIFTLPTASTLEAVTVPDLPAPTQLEPTRSTEASENEPYLTRIRGLAFFLFAFAHRDAHLSESVIHVGAFHQSQDRTIPVKFVAIIDAKIPCIIN